MRQFRHSSSIVISLILCLITLAFAEQFSAQSDSVIIRNLGLEKSYWTETDSTSHGRIVSVNLCDSFAVIPPEIFKLTALKHLTICRVNLREIPAQIANLTQLETFTIVSCSLQTLPVELFSLTSLKQLNISNNQITSLPWQIGNLINLELLDASRCKLSTLPEAISQCRKLRKLNLSSNEIESLPKGLNALVSLKEIDFWSNPLKSLPEDMFPMQQLSSIGLQHTLVEKLPEAIGYSPKLKSIYADESRLTTIPASLAKVKDITIDLVRTPLTSLPTEIIEASRQENITVKGAHPVLPCDKFHFVDSTAFLDSGCIGVPLDTSLYKVVVRNEMWHDDTMNIPQLYHPSGLRIHYFPKRNHYSDFYVGYHGLLTDNAEKSGNLYSFGEVTALKENKEYHDWKAPIQSEILDLKLFPEKYDTVNTITLLNRSSYLHATIARNRITLDTVTYNNGIPYLLDHTIISALTDSSISYGKVVINYSFEQWKSMSADSQNFVLNRQHKENYKKRNPPTDASKIIMDLGYPHIFAVDFSTGFVGTHGVGLDFFARPGITGMGGGIGIQYVPDRGETVDFIDYVFWGRGVATYFYTDIGDKKGKVFAGPEIGFKGEGLSFRLGWNIDTNGNDNHLSASVGVNLMSFLYILAL